MMWNALRSQLFWESVTLLNFITMNVFEGFINKCHCPSHNEVTLWLMSLCPADERIATYLYLQYYDLLNCRGDILWKNPESCCKLSLNILYCCRFMVQELNCWNKWNFIMFEIVHGGVWRRTEQPQWAVRSRAAGGQLSLTENSSNMQQQIRSQLTQ